MKIWITSILGAASVLLFLPSLHAQADYTAFRTTRIQAGAGGLYLKNDYTEHSNKGVSAWADYDFNRFVGAEAEVHFGSIISPDDIGENSYFIGPRVSYHRRNAAFYAKIMVGRASITNQQTSTSSTYNAYAFGGGLDYKVSRHFNVRVVDFELQKWPDFEPNTLSPLAISVGLMYIIR